MTGKILNKFCKINYNVNKCCLILYMIKISNLIMIITTIIVKHKNLRIVWGIILLIQKIDQKFFTEFKVKLISFPYFWKEKINSRKNKICKCANMKDIFIKKTFKKKKMKY